MRRIVIVFCLVVAYGLGNSQSLYNVGTTLSIGSNTILSVGDSVVNNGTIINNGDIQVAGFWLNNGTYEPGQGQLTLTSSLPQVINHNDQSFTRLKIEGGGDKIFGADIYIINELVLASGNLVSTSGSKLVIEDGAIISGGSDNSYIDGPIYHVGTGNKYFPVGSGNVFLPLELVDVKGTSPTVGVLLTLPNTNTSVQGNLAEVSKEQYWQLDVIGGVFDGSQVVLPLRDEIFIGDISRAVVAQSPSINDPYASLGISAITGDLLAGTVTSELATTGMFLTVGRFEAEAGKELFIYNAVSPNNDGMNDFFKILNIDAYPDNIVTIYTRWGDKVFEMTGYDNLEKIFDGHTNVNKSYMLADGTYYYVVEKDADSKGISGYLVLHK